MNLRQLSNKLLNILFPIECLSCKKQGEFLCAKCLDAVPFPAPGKENNKTVFASASYKSKIIKKAIKELKYKNSKQLAKPLAGLIYKRCIKTNLIPQIASKNDCFCIIPIPIHKKKLRKRGYNQTEAIGKFLSDIADIDIYNDVLYKNSSSLSQVNAQNRETRIKNIAGSFSVRNAGKITGKTVLILDDVLTTGATMSEAIKTLRKAGAKDIYGLVVAM